MSLTGETEFQGFIERLVFDLRVLAGPVGADVDDVNVLAINEAMSEYGISKNLSALLPVMAGQFEDLRDCLRHADCVDDAFVTVGLTVDGLPKERGVEEKIFPIEGDQMKIVHFSWEYSSGGAKS